MNKQVSTELWSQIRIRWTQGESGYSIANSLDGHPTRQAIAKRARSKGWQKEVDGVVSEKHLRKHPALLGRDNPENREEILRLLSNGVTYKLAAGSIGVHPDTLRAWRKQDSSFSAQCQSARASALADCAMTIYRHKDRDWRAGKYLLETAPETRGEFGSSNNPGKIEVVINIDRSSKGVGVKGSVIDVTPEKVNGD